MIKGLMIGIAALALTQAAPLNQAAFADTDAVVSVAEQGQHAEWSALLAKYVSESADGVNRFDYGALKDNAADSAALDAYIDRFATMKISELPRDEQYVAWINLYNAVTVQYIRDRYPTKTIKNSLFGPWKKIFTTAEGRQISLNDIEHEVLRKDWSEPRTHYAVNCASFGCPNLKPTAWETATLEEDLTAAARAYINHPRGVTIRKDGALQVSTIYKWFKKDFGTKEAKIIEHLLQYAEPELAAKINARPDIKSYKYDWSLNGK
ncbi:MAG: DUF547 domain-containing protein [Pseudomonadota bacterium]